MFVRTMSSLCVLVAVFLAGCAVGPNYRKPQTTMPAKWVGQPAPATQPSPVSANLANWWKTFNDPTLTSLMDRAIRANLDIKQAQARVLEARASRGIATAGLGPTLGGNAGFTRSGRGNGQSTSLFQTGLDAGWELDIFGGTRRNIEAAKADLQAAQEDLNDTLVTLTAEVALNYIDLRQFQQEILIAQENLKAQQHTADVVRVKFRGGLVGALDVANAESQVATTAAQIPQLQTSAKETIYTLSVLLARDPGALLAELSPAGEIPAGASAVPLGLPSDLLRRRPDIRRAEAQLHAATARIGVAIADLLPSFTMNAGARLEGNSLRNLTSVENRIWSFGPSMNWTLFNSGANLWNVSLSRVQAQAAFLTYRQTLLTAMQDVENALVASENEREHNRLLAQAVESNRKAVDLSTRLYAAGQTDFLNVLNAQRSLLASQDALAQSTRTISQNQVSLYKALGGGWQSQAATQPAKDPKGLLNKILYQVSGGELGKPKPTTQPAK